MDRLEKADKIAFTASTGVAACNIRGLTIHSWAGIGILMGIFFIVLQTNFLNSGRATDSHEMIIAQVRGNRNARTRWKETEILVIDEISMLSGELLDLLSRVGKDVRGDNRPFGGMQVILCGDFFQLPPIGLGGKVHFCFESDTWRQLFQGGGLVVLDTVFRQKDDVTFLNILNEMRTGKVSQVASQVLGNRVRQCNDKAYSTSGDASLKDTIGEVRPTKLFATNRDVDAFNASEMLRLSQLGGEGPDNVQRYKSIDEGVEPYLQQLKQGTKAPEFLELRIGAQVRLH
jgi:ATP-dependent DNA helicase PIF1